MKLFVTVAIVGASFLTGTCEKAAGAVDFDDVTTVLSNFGLPLNCDRLGDADRIGSVNFADVTAVLSHFNMTYCPTQGQSFTGSFGNGFSTMGVEGETMASSFGNISDALATMGYVSIDDFTDAIEAMSEEDRNAEVQTLGGLLGGE